MEVIQQASNAIEDEEVVAAIKSIFGDLPDEEKPTMGAVLLSRSMEHEDVNGKIDFLLFLLDWSYN